MTRNMAIKWLRWILNMFPKDSEQAKALNYAIDSLLVDEAYQLEYEKVPKFSPNEELKQLYEEKFMPIGNKNLERRRKENAR